MSKTVVANELKFGMVVLFGSQPRKILSVETVDDIRRRVKIKWVGLHRCDLPESACPVASKKFTLVK